MQNHIVRGIIIGGSCGAFAALFGLVDDMPRTIALGMVAGFCAGITLAHRQKKKDNDSEE